MSVAIARPQQKVAGRLDLSVPVLVLIGLFLCVLVLLPLGWLVWYSITDQDGALTFENFLRLALDPAFATPYLTAFEIAAGVALGAVLLPRRSPGSSPAPICRCAARSVRLSPLPLSHRRFSARSPGRSWRRRTAAC